ncbi:MAG: hypothetical protein NTW12_07155 [Deltaproteobacteria bacterium]|nr:hypothetical protein [Deltaproteobacteria bacterium]
MKRFFSSALCLLVVAFFSGCIQDTTVIHIKPDGSGTIEETALFSNTMLELMESLADSMGNVEKQKGDQDNKNAVKGDSKKGEKKTRDDVIAKLLKDAETRAKMFGSTVKFISAKPVKTDTGSGYSAVYAFQDISLVKVNQNPSDKVDGKKAEKSDSPPKEEYLLFSFIKGSPSRLVVTFPARKDAGGDTPSAPDTTKGTEEKPNKESDNQSLEMMKNLFQDMKLKISLHIEGTIVKTNATYRDGSTVTLIEMDFGKIVSNPELFKKLSASKPESIEETKALVKSVEGLKFEINNPVTVDFK